MAEPARNPDGLKAWLVREKDEFAATVVFAETRGKAKAIARYTDACEDVPYTHIEATRMPEADKYYREGKVELDWNDPTDRIALVRDCGFRCDYDSFDLEDCAVCPAKEHCDLYIDRMCESEED